MECTVALATLSVFFLSTAALAQLATEAGRRRYRSPRF